MLKNNIFEMKMQSQYGQNGSGIIYSTEIKEYEIDSPKSKEKSGKLSIELSPQSLKIIFPTGGIMEEKISEYGSGKTLEGKVEYSKKSFTKYELAKKSIEGTFIVGVGTGIVATAIFGYKVGIVTAVLSSALNIYGIFYRNKHYSEYY